MDVTTENQFLVGWAAALLTLAVSIGLARWIRRRGHRAFVRPLLLLQAVLGTTMSAALFYYSGPLAVVAFWVLLGSVNVVLLGVTNLLHRNERADAQKWELILSRARAVAK